MSNRFFQYVDPLIAGTVAKSSEVNAKFEIIETSFDDLELEVNTAIKLPASEGSTNIRLTPAAADRQGHMLGFDVDGTVFTTAKFVIDWDMNNLRLRNLPVAQEIDEPVTLGQLQAYSTGLVAGIPPIAGEEGPLVTDGATVEWGGPDRLIPSVASEEASSMLVYNGIEVAWTLHKANICADPNGTQGAAYWDTDLDAVEDQSGPHWENVDPLVAASFEHVSNSAGLSPCTAGSTVTGGVTMYTGGITNVGNLSFALRFYDAAKSFLADSPTVSIIELGVASNKRYFVSATAPSLTAYVSGVVTFDALDADASGVKIRDMKIEDGTGATPFTDDKTTILAIGAKEVNPFGAGFASPSIVLGDTSSTTAAINLRSKDGSQDFDTQFLSSAGINGSEGHGLLKVSAGTTRFTGPAGYMSEYDAGNSGASITINFLNGSKQKLTLDTITPAITFYGPGLPIGHYQLKVIQDPAVARVPTYVGIVAGDCVGNVLPTITSTLSGVTFIYLYWDGTQFWVSSAQWD